MLHLGAIVYVYPIATTDSVEEFLMGLGADSSAEPFSAADASGEFGKGLPA